MTSEQDDLARRFERQRGRLRAIAVQLLGSAADADDAVQETWLRLGRVDPGGIRNLDAWLTTVVSRVSLDMLRAPRRTRERSWQVEPWRDEPVATAPDPAELAAAADRASVALLVVLERLTPAERIAFVLHDVFGLPFGEVAEALERSPDAARQLASRGRRRVQGAPLRPGTGSVAPAPAPAPAPVPAPPSPANRRRIVEAWLAAAEGGDLAALLALLRDDAVLVADYGESTQTVSGAADIAAQAVLSGRLAAHSTPVLIDGMPGVAARSGDRVVSLLRFEIVGEQIVALQVLADPRRLPRADVLDGRPVADPGVHPDSGRDAHPGDTREDGVRR